MDTFNTSYPIWALEPLRVKILVLGLYIFVLFAIARIARIGTALYRMPKDPDLSKEMLLGKIDPERFANYALRNSAPWGDRLAEYSKLFSSQDHTAQKLLSKNLLYAESLFNFLCERCAADLESAKNASLLAFLISLITIAYGAVSTYALFYEGNRDPMFCLLLSAEQRLKTLAIGLSLCFVLCLMSGIFSRKLSNRKADWKYFFARLKVDLSFE